MTLIKAVVFDWGGVLAKNVMPDIFSYVSSKLGVDTETLIPVYEKYQHDFLINTISERKFWEKVAADLEVATPDNPGLFEEALGNFYEPKNRMLKVVKTLKERGIMTGLLSDAEKGAAKLYFKDSQPLFDAIVFSSVVGVEKPDRRIYELMLKELDTRPEETVFFDDNEENIAGAKRLGINAFRFETVEQVKTDLSSLGITLP